MSLFTVTENDKRIYNEQIRDFLPDKVIDIHTHVWKGTGKIDPRAVAWPSLVAPDNSIEDITEAYKLFFPGKEVTPMIFASAIYDLDTCHSRNAYIADAMKRSGYPALYYCHPQQSAYEVEREIFRNGYLGLKGYLILSPSYIPEAEIRILDFFPPHLLEVANRNKLMVMLHVPRNGRFKDPVNLEQIRWICETYPEIRLVIAHVGRAYCENDVGNAFERLKGYDNLYFDFTANCNEKVFEQMLENVSPDRIMFGSDEPILRMRTHRIEENGRYINLIPPGLYGDPKQDSHLREVSPEEAEKITFFMYEEILAMKEAVRVKGLGKDAVDKMFFGTADKLITFLRQQVRA